MGDNLENERLRVLRTWSQTTKSPSIIIDGHRCSFSTRCRGRCTMLLQTVLNFLRTGMSCRQSKIGMAMDVWSSIWRRNRSDGFSTLREKRSTASELR